MCGIAGTFTTADRLPDPDLLLAMAHDLEHRGPDGVGTYRDGRFGMVATRLSIIDLATGDPPIGNEDGRYWAIQNGEIFNYLELNEELERLGHRFRTRSDTETIVHAYEQWGEGCLEHLNGEFAFAIWDRKRQEAFLARDRFGIRPLYLAEWGGDVSFASEPAALLRHPSAERRLDPYAVIETFHLWAVAPDRSAFAGIRELPPGHHLRIGPDGAGEPVRWWDLEFGPREGFRQESPEALAEELRHLLDDATRIRLRADVPVGVYLSGGLDSSITSMLARRHVPNELRAFGVGFEDTRFDESSHQDAMAQALGVDLERVTVSDRDVAESFPEVVRRAQMPLLRTAPGPLLRLAGAVQDADMKVVLTGEGADELFGGYGVFQEAMVRRFWAKDPESRMRPALLARIYPYLSRDLAAGGGFAAEFFRQGIENLDDPLYALRPRIATTSRNLKFLSREVRDAASAVGEPTERLLARLPDGFDRFGPLGKAQYLEIATFMSGYLLHGQGDRMLMGRSIEGRFPFLDPNVAAFAAALPERVRLRDMQEKWLLRRAFRDLLPPEIANRPKRPYRAPIVRSFFGPGAPDWVGELLEPDRIASVGVFSPKAVQRLAAKCEKYVDVGLGESEEMGLVGVLSTMLLHDAHIERPEPAGHARPTREIVGDRRVASTDTTEPDRYEPAPYGKA